MGGFVAQGETGHTIARGVALRCGVCVEYGRASGSPAHESVAREERLVRAFAAMLATERDKVAVVLEREYPTSDMRMTIPAAERPETDAEYAGRLVERGLAAFESASLGGPSS